MGADQQQGTIVLNRQIIETGFRRKGTIASMVGGADAASAVNASMVLASLRRIAV